MIGIVIRLSTYILGEIVDEISKEQSAKPVQNKAPELIRCEECRFETRMSKQMETHKRIKHIDGIKYACDKCDYNSSTHKRST